MDKKEALTILKKLRRRLLITYPETTEETCEALQVAVWEME